MSRRKKIHLGISLFILAVVGGAYLLIDRDKEVRHALDGLSGAEGFLFDAPYKWGVILNILQLLFGGAEYIYHRRSGDYEAVAANDQACHMIYSDPAISKYRRTVTDMNAPVDEQVHAIIQLLSLIVPSTHPKDVSIDLKIFSPDERKTLASAIVLYHNPTETVSKKIKKQLLLALRRLAKPLNQIDNVRELLSLGVCAQVGGRGEDLSVPIVDPVDSFFCQYDLLEGQALNALHTQRIIPPAAFYIVQLKLYANRSQLASGFSGGGEKKALLNSQGTKQKKTLLRKAAAVWLSMKGLQHPLKDALKYAFDDLAVDIIAGLDDILPSDALIFNSKGLVLVLPHQKLLPETHRESAPETLLSTSSDGPDLDFMLFSSAEIKAIDRVVYDKGKDLEGRVKAMIHLLSTIDPASRIFDDLKVTCHPDFKDRVRIIGQALVFYQAIVSQDDFSSLVTAHLTLALRRLRPWINASGQFRSIPGGLTELKDDGLDVDLLDKTEKVNSRLGFQALLKHRIISRLAWHTSNLEKFNPPKKRSLSSSQLRSPPSRSSFSFATYPSSSSASSSSAATIVPQEDSVLSGVGVPNSLEHQTALRAACKELLGVAGQSESIRLRYTQHPVYQALSNAVFYSGMDRNFSEAIFKECGIPMQAGSPPTPVSVVRSPSVSLLGSSPSDPQLYVDTGARVVVSAS